MKATLPVVLMVSLIGDILVFLSAAVFLTHKGLIKGLVRYATPFAAGALLSAAFLDFLYDGVQNHQAFIVLLAALIGLIFFFVLDGVLHWFHHHSKEAFDDKHDHDKAEPVVALAAAGNWLHNFIDGAAIAAAFLVSSSAGIITTIAVALHEIPREIADSGYFLSRGMKRRGVIVVHGVAIIFTIVGTALFFFTGSNNGTVLAWLLGSTAGFFIYIGASDIMPSIKLSRKDQNLFDEQILMVILGALSVGAVIAIAHRYIG